jgi:hypothetical protein
MERMMKPIVKVFVVLSVLMAATASQSFAGQAENVKKMNDMGKAFHTQMLELKKKRAELAQLEEASDSQFAELMKMMQCVDHNDNPGQQHCN